MTAKELKNKYFSFFKERGHSIIPSASLIPENDPSVLFTTAGMHPLVPFLLGETHPAGKRLVDVQVCLRTDDIDEGGDTSHHTFFEMLGNWSLGDYWKEESLSWSYEFLTKELDLDPHRLWVTCFAGDKDAPKDTEAETVWRKLGIPEEKIFFYGKKDNWWGPAGETGPCGPDSEIFYDTSSKTHGSDCKPGDNCGRFFEIWNNVFMQYNKTGEGKFEPLSQKNVDTGMGVERATAIVQGLNDNFHVKDLWGEIISSIEEITKSKYKENEKAHRIIADHIRAATFVIAEGIIPSNKERGYVLRRLIRRAVRFGRILGVNKAFTADISKWVVESYSSDYPLISEKQDVIYAVLTEEEEKFGASIGRGLKEVEKTKTLDGKTAFFLYETYGFPLELSEEIARERGQRVEKKAFEEEFNKHKNLSRTASAGMFRGGLADRSEETTKLHTATHLLHASLRKVLGNNVQQKGSNITSERLRFDFSHNSKLSEKEVKNIEKLINDVIKNDLPVSFETKTYEEAIKEGSLAFFGEKYGDKVKVYSVGDSKGKWFSKEVCGGPHVTRTGEIGHVRINKQEKIGSGLVRVYVTLGKLT